MTDVNAGLREKLTSAARRIVVKVGSGVLTGEKYKDVDDDVVAEIARQVAELMEHGCDVAIVSSGSVAIGARKLKLARHGLAIPVKQAAAAVGQNSLVGVWAKHFEPLGLQVGQILLTSRDLENRERFLNARNTINTLFEFGVAPVINENDTVAIEELKFGDNDTLSAKVTNVTMADILVIMSDVDGLYTADPKVDKTAQRIDIVEKVDDGILALAGDSSSRTGLGGMSSKVMAAKEAAEIGVPTMIIPGVRKGALLSAMAGEAVGTLFLPSATAMSSKRHWIEYTLKTRGEIHIDGGAVEAVTHRGKSLLASGVTAVKGSFDAGEAAHIYAPDGRIIAKGLVNYSSHELDRIKGLKSGLIEDTLGYKAYDEVIHRDNMVVYNIVDDYRERKTG